MFTFFVLINLITYHEVVSENSKQKSQKYFRDERGVQRIHNIRLNLAIFKTGNGESGNQGIGESGNPGIGESGNRGIRESGNPGIRE